jgi:hypothetical protein
MRTLPRWPLPALALLLALAVLALFARNLSDRAGPAEPAAPAAREPVRARVAGVALTIPRDFVRSDAQARGGDLARVDLLFRWPSLEGVGSGERLGPDAIAELVFVTLAPKDQALDPPQRLAAVYSRFLDAEVRREGTELASRRFRVGSGYDGEDLVYDPVRSGDFFARCAPPAGDAPSTCLREIRVGALDVVYRFPRGLLEDRRRLDRSVAALLAAIGAPGGG